jgi:hypothetical protein
VIPFKLKGLKSLKYESLNRIRLVIVKCDAEAIELEDVIDLERSPPFEFGIVEDFLMS